MIGKYRFLAIITYFNLTLIAFGLLSCGLTEPEPFQNKPDDYRPFYGYAQYKWQQNDPQAGILLLNVHEENNPGEILHEYLYVDSIFVNPDYTKSFPFAFDSRVLPNGPHKILFNIYYGPSPSKGMLNLLDIPLESIDTTIVFNHLPLPVSDITLHTKSGSYHPFITWDYPPILENEVIYYVVNRIDNATQTIYHSDTVYTHSHSFTDTTFTASGYDYDYSVGVVNSVGISYSYDIHYTSN